MTHPDYIVAPEARDELPMLEPVYPLTAGLSGKVLTKATRQALEKIPGLHRVAGADVARRPRLAGLRHGLEAAASAGGCGRRLAGLVALAAARL